MSFGDLLSASPDFSFLKKKQSKEMAHSIHCDCKDIFTRQQLLESGIHLPYKIGATGNLVNQIDDDRPKAEEETATSSAVTAIPAPTESESPQSPSPPSESTMNVDEKLDNLQVTSPMETIAPSGLIITSHMVSPAIKHLTKKFCKRFNVLHVHRFQHLPDIVMHVVIEGYITRNYKERKLLSKMKKGGAVFVKSSWIRESMMNGVMRSPVFYYIDDVDRMLPDDEIEDSSSD